MRLFSGDWLFDDDSQRYTEAYVGTPDGHWSGGETFIVSLEVLRAIKAWQDKLVGTAVGSLEYDKIQILPDGRTAFVVCPDGERYEIDQPRQGEYSIGFGWCWTEVGRDEVTKVIGREDMLDEEPADEPFASLTAKAEKGSADWRKEREDRVMTAATAGVTLDQIGTTITSIERSIKEWEEGRMTSPDDRDHVIAACEAMGVDWHQIDRDSDNDIVGKIAEEVYEDSGETITDIPDLATFILTRLFQLGVRPSNERSFHIQGEYRDGDPGYAVIGPDYKVVAWFDVTHSKSAEELRDKLNAGEVEVAERIKREFLVHLNIQIDAEAGVDVSTVQKEIEGALEVGLDSDYSPFLRGAEVEVALAEEIT